MLSVCIIINPVSGQGKQKLLLPTVKNFFYQHPEINFKLLLTEYSGHATVLAKQAAEEKFDVVIAVGGDGTVNEIAQALVYTDTALAILPYGSGNGLANFLHVPKTIEAMFPLILNNQPKIIDTATINGHFFVNVAGVGFDAIVAKHFAKGSKRGLWTYLKVVVEKYHFYKPKKYKIVINGNIYKEKALMISFANSNQYGNNIYISPTANIQDGLIDVCIVKKIPIYDMLNVLSRLFLKNIHESSYVRIIKANSVEVSRKKSIKGHIDGEPCKLENLVVVQVQPSSLKVLF